MLEWDVSDLKRSVNFLDLTITITPEGYVQTKTYQKEMNLYLYIPPSSAHPPGAFKGLVFGNLQTYWLQNSKKEDFIAIARSFAQHLIARGFSPQLVDTLYREAGRRLDEANQRRLLNGPLPKPTKDDHRDTLFLHWRYHPRDISRQAIRQAYDATCAGHTGFARLIIAYSRPKNLRDALMKTQMDEPEGSRASNFLEPNL